MSGIGRSGRIAARPAGLFVALVCVGALPSAFAQAADEKPQAPAPATAVRIVDVQAGLAGKFKVSYWTPFVVELEAGSQALRGRVELLLPDGDGVPSRVQAPPGNGEIALEPRERKSVVVYAKLGQLASEVRIGFRGQDNLLATRRFSTSADGPLAGVLPSTSTLLAVVSGESATSDPAQLLFRGKNVARIDQLDTLPTEWWGYEGVDALIITTGDEGIASQLAAAGPQLAAIDRWVRMGGQLVVSVGRNAERVLAEGAPLAALVPGRLEAVVPLRRSTALETFAETVEPLSTDVRFELTVPQFSDVRGQIEAYAGTGQRDLPLVVRTPHGFGEIVLAAFDIDQAPIAGWKARSQLLDRLLRRPKGPSDESGDRLGAVTTLGFVDLAGQLRGALDQFPGVQLVPFWLVALLVVVYIACIGPLDYYLVKRVFRRMEATWLTFAVTVLVFSGGAFALAYGLKGREVRLNQLDVVDFDTASGLVRGTSWANVFSPQIDTYDLAFRPADISAESTSAGTLFSWFGLTGTAFGGMDVSQGVGGMDAASSSLPLFTVAYDYGAPGNTIRDVPIAVWSSKAFLGRWWREGPGGIDAALADDDRLVGTLTSTLDVPLTDAVLIYGKWAYVLRRFEAGSTIDVDAIDPQTADTYLRHVTAQGDRQVTPPYDQESFEVARIVEMMSAHELAGGRRYTGLTHRYLQFTELSRLVQNGRAVLIGRVERPAAALKRGAVPLAPAATQNWTFYRYVFPVEQADAD